MTSTTRSNLARLALLICTLIWGVSFVVLKNTLDTIPPHYLLTLRFGSATILMAAFFWKKIRLIDLATLGRGALMGVFLFSAYSVQTLGLTTISPGKNAFLTAVYCVIVPYLNWAVFRNKPTKANLAAAFLCLGGIGLISLTADLSVAPGDLLTLAGGAFFAVHIVAVSRFSQKSDIFSLTILQFTVAALLSTGIAVATEGAPPAILPSSVWGLLYLTVGATFVCLLLQNVGQKYTDAPSASIILSLESVFGVVFSIILYGEIITVRMAAGFALIFAAIMLSESAAFKGVLKRRKQHDNLDHESLDQASGL